MEYRTEKQFLEIVDSVGNGNFSQATDECIEYGFYAYDLVKGLKNLIELGYYEEASESHIDLLESFVELAENITEKRYKKE